MRALSLAAALVATGITLAAGHAEAQSTTTVETRTWYGWQVLLVDASGYGMIAGGAVADFGPLLGAGVATLALGPGLVHLAHGRPGVAAGSVALQVGAPLVAGFLGVLVACNDGCSGMFAGLFGALIGGGLGHVTAVAIDVAALSYDTKTTKITAPTGSAASAIGRRARTSTPAIAPRVGSRAPRWTPTIDLVIDDATGVARGATLGAVGMF